MTQVIKRTSKFFLSDKSLARLDGVDPRLVKVVQDAIKISTVDFGVVCGVRTIEEQQALFDSPASNTMKSKHLLALDKATGLEVGRAVDLMAYVGARCSWEIALYDNIADAMREAAIVHDLEIRWGGAWNVPDIRAWKGGQLSPGVEFDATMQGAADFYAYKCLQQTDGSKPRKPFFDGPHFELN